MTGLGAPVDYFPLSRTSRLIAPIMAAVLMIIASAITCGWGVDTGYGGYLRYGLASVYDLMSVPVIFTVGLFIGGIATGLVCARQSAAGVWWFMKKVWSIRTAAGLQPVRWEEIGEFYLSITRQFQLWHPHRDDPITTRLKSRAAGSWCSIIAIENVQHLGGLIGRNILPIQYKLAADVYNSGQTASFGPVAVSRAGLTVSKKTYPWNEIEQVSVHDGVFKVSKKGGGWFSGASTPVASIPNLEAMLSIIDQVVGVKVGKQDKKAALL